MTMFKQITILGIQLDVTYSTSRDANDNGVGGASTEITIESVTLKDDGLDIQDLLSDYVISKINDAIMEAQ